ncbi:hypothetical protein Bca101_072176 [Brassica carinata]
MNSELLAFPSSLVGGCSRPHRLFTDPFPYPIPSWVDVPEADSEAIREGDHADIRRKYVIHPSVRMRNPSVGMKNPFEFERAPDGGETEVSSYFGLCPSQLTPLTWRTLMAIQVLGEFHRFSVGVNEILYSYYFAPLVNKARFYHLQSRDGAPLVEEPSRGIRDVSRPVSFAGEAVAKLIMGVPRRFRWVTFLVSKEALRHSRVWGKPFLLSFHLIGFRHSLQGMWAASSVNGLSSTSSTGAQAASNHDPLVDAHQRLIGEVFFLRSQVNDMMACRDLLVQLVRASSKWDLMRERLEKLVEHWILKKSIADIYSCPGGSTSSRGVFPGSPPRILLWGRDSRRSLLSE